jgi:hypothetical protein
MAIELASLSCLCQWSRGLDERAAFRLRRTGAELDQYSWDRKSLAVAVAGTMAVLMLVLVLGGHAVVGLISSGLAFRHFARLS